MDISDPQLITEYLEGNESSLQELIRKHTPTIYNFVYFLGGGENTDDIVQEVFIKVWKNLKKYNPERNFKTWIMSIARNTTIDWMRKRKHVVFTDLDNPDNDTTFADTLADPEPLPDALLQRVQNGQYVEELISQLGPNYREVVTLHYMHNFTFKEIAEILGKPINTVKSGHRRALIQLRTLLEKTPV